MPTGMGPSGMGQLPVWSKNSCGLSPVVFEQSAKSFTTLNWAISFAYWAGRRKEQDIALALMIALLMVMIRTLVEYMPQGAFAEQNHAGQRFVFDRWYPPHRQGIQVWP